MSRTHITITYPGALVDEHKAGFFYYKVTPKVREGRTVLDDRERKQIVNEVIKEMQGKLKRVKI